MVTVTTVLEGAAPETVEREVSQVLEESINTIEGIRTLRSASSDSLSIIYVEFELEYDIQEKAQEVRDKVAAVRGGAAARRRSAGRRPRRSGRRPDPGGHARRAPTRSGPSRSSRTSASSPGSSAFAGVGSVSLVGDRPREIRVWIDPLRLAGYGLAVDDVLSARSSASTSSCPAVASRPGAQE